MPLDHFVSQVHLRNFYTDGGRLVGVKKDDLKKFYAKSEDVCRRLDGSTNDYLREPRAIEEFLRNIEPNYNAAVTALRNREIDADGVYVIAGFVAYVLACSPTAMRLGKPHLAAAVQTAAEILDANGKLPKVPDILGGKSLTDLLSDGSVVVNVDGRYPQAIGIANILAHAGTFGNALWDVMFADAAGGGFLTSDFPIAFGHSYDSRVVSKLVPLAPDVALCIHPMLRERSKPPDLSFAKFRARFREVPFVEVRKINQQLVRAAETMIFSSVDGDWLLPFVRKNRDFRAETLVERIPAPTGGRLIVATQRIVPYKRPELVTA
jgi:hypothetical protein